MSEVPEAEGEQLPFDAEFQKSLLRLLAEDDGFGVQAVKHLRPEYFESDVLQWIFATMARYHESYQAVPSLDMVQQSVRHLDARIQAMYAAVVDQVKQASLRDQFWLKDQVLEFVKRNIFVRMFHESRDLYNTGQSVKAYDLVMEKIDELHRTAWETTDRSWLFDELQARQAKRIERAAKGDAIPTGFPWLDHILNGGLHIGELGIWLAYPKIGKSTMLLNLGKQAVRRFMKVMHIVLEGSKKLIEDRYDAAILDEVYHDVKMGRITAEKYSLAIKEYHTLRGLMVIESAVDVWDYNVLNLDDSLRDLERNHGWRPDLIIVDYADLMTGRDKKYYRTETESQRAAYRDLKRLTNRDYAIWTASQATRPKRGDDEKPHILKSDSVADTFEKVRAADFLGSLNQTNTEKDSKVMNVYAEMYRDNPAGQHRMVYCDASRMIIKADANVLNPHNRGSDKEEAIGHQRPQPQQQAAF